jgi:nucleoside-triphosphatase
LLQNEGIPVFGFLTREIRERGRRVGFRIETPAGDRGVLAHIDLAGPPTVGRYGVDLDAFERIALPALSDIPEAGVAVIDELGKMELASERFRDAVLALWERPVSVVATVMAGRHPVTDRLKREAEVVRLTAANRDRLPAELAERLSPSPPPS